MLITVTSLMLSTGNSGVMNIVKPVLSILPFVLLLTEGKWKTAAKYLVLYAVCFALERLAQARHKIIERDILDQLAIEHQIVAQRLVNGPKERLRRTEGTLAGIAAQRGKRRLHRVDNHLHDILGNSIEQAVHRAKVHVESLAVDIGLARDGTHRNVCQRLFHEQALKSGKDGIAAANDTAVKTLFAGGH